MSASQRSEGGSSHVGVQRDDGTTEEQGTQDSNLHGNPSVGLGGGFIATVTMTIFRAPTARSLPPTANFLSRWVGGDPDDYPFSSLGLHLLYGICAGLLFNSLWPRLARRTEEPEVAGLVTGAMYGALLSLFGERVVLRYLVGMTLDTDESAVFHAGHLVYGLTLGVWVASRSPAEQEAAHAVRRTLAASIGPSRPFEG